MTKQDICFLVFLIFMLILAVIGGITGFWEWLDGTVNPEVHRLFIDWLCNQVYKLNYYLEHLTIGTIVIIALTIAIILLIRHIMKLSRQVLDLQEKVFEKEERDEQK